ncbi:hypothetical protein HII17_06050 [Thalassotalea sp. M1531]|uniref:NodB homology domain-containing protein n=1 Tax=Thalassotalea algicola TaxID=2716224 RepID=A0A7Y0LAS7_9GAMM|nr:hypothetical protein [Thalassotalea algicola]NMP31123.1 hypothetical protein [Thalassotalea algicola]
MAHHSHNHLSAKKVETQAYLNDFNKAYSILHTYDRMLKFNRHPYLHFGQGSNKRKAIAPHLQSKGYEFGYITADNYDWFINSKLINAQAIGLAVDYEKLGQLYVDTLMKSIKFYDHLALKMFAQICIFIA